ncbi:MAG TPA: NAD(P)-dependent oxidoreductase [Candidatus Eremiobacteraceae bacterium]|nr:NAD(P)-dependent oxidoreductase [Candidatus Eremiobacteraceae bacterium]
MTETVQTNASSDALAELLPPLTRNEAAVESARCLMCYDAPCTQACPTHIDIPKFIKKIATRNLRGSARTILESNLLGATCARVCPVQELCEGACVLGKEHKPIAIGRLQRHAMDHAYDNGLVFFQPARSTGKKVAVIGAGPAGLSCAGELAKRGHSVTLFEKRNLAGGLSTYGIIRLREPVEVALAEVGMLSKLGIKIETGKELGTSLDLAQLQKVYDAVFLSVGLGVTTTLGIPGEEHIVDGLEYIEQSKMDVNNLAIGRSVIVIGAGNTAIDCATIAKRLGADQVIMVYRRSEKEMTAYAHEYDFIKREGVRLLFLTKPVRVHLRNGVVHGLDCQRVSLGPPDASGRPSPQPVTGSEFLIPADQIVKATGQEKPRLASLLNLKTNKGFIQVDRNFETSLPGVYAGGDCIRAQGAASTVMAVQDGKLAAGAIHERLVANG